MINKLTELQQKNIVEYKSLADDIAAKRKRSKLRHIGSVSLDDIQAVAYSGLIDAAKKYDSSKGGFKGYAAVRINGHITDYIRSIIGRGTNKKKKPKMVSMECPLPFSFNDEHETTIEDTLTAREPEKENSGRTEIFFLTAMQSLSGWQRTVVIYYFYKNYTMREVSEVFGISEASVSLLVHSAVDSMKKYWQINNSEDLFLELHR